jgi:hypothetical protein
MLQQFLQWLQTRENVPRWVFVWILAVMLIGIGVALWLIVAMQRCGC